MVDDSFSGLLTMWVQTLSGASRCFLEQEILPFIA
jgi:hypothetical protein